MMKSSEKLAIEFKCKTKGHIYQDGEHGCDSDGTPFIWVECASCKGKLFKLYL